MTTEHTNNNSEELLQDTVENRGKYVQDRNIPFLLYNKPAYFSKLWLYIMNEAKFKKTGRLAPGEFEVPSYAYISETLIVPGGKAERKITVEEIRRAFHFFRTKQLIKTSKNGVKLLIKVLNYEESQRFSTTVKNGRKTMTKPSDLYKGGMKSAKEVLTNVINVTNMKRGGTNVDNPILEGQLPLIAEE